MVAGCMQEGERCKVEARASGIDRGKESSRRCGALPRAEVIDRGCSENGGVIRRAGLWREEEEEEKQLRESDGDGDSEKVRGTQRLIYRGARKERVQRCKEGARKKRRGSECKRRPLEGFACSCIDRGLGSAVHLHPLASHRCCRLRHPLPSATLAPERQSSRVLCFSLLFSPFSPVSFYASIPPVPHPAKSPCFSHPFLYRVVSRAPHGPDLAQPPNRRRRRHGAGCCAPRL